MAPPLDTLTEKEKQALRLLVTGYDAKSMARRLGLSVHTINERLRDARRKLGTSSSREAARMLREVEAADPELFGDKALGDAPVSATMEHLHSSPRPFGAPRRLALIAGALIMSIVLSIFALAALGGSDAAPSPQAPVATASAEQTAVLQAAEVWFALVDKGDWRGSYALMGAQFRSLNTAERWAEVSQRVHGDLGALQSRELMTVDFAPAPPNGYWTVKYRVSYAKRGAVVETLSLAFEEGRWKVVGVVID